MEIFKLFGSILVDNEAANKSISETDNKAGGLAEKLSKGVGTAAKWGAGLAVAAAGVGAAMFNAADKAAQAADEVDKGSIRMGISAERFQELRYAAGQSGVEMGTLEKAAKKLEGTDINFDDAINSIMELGTEEERTAKASELFGDAIAYQMAPILAQTGEEFDALTSRADELGLVMSEDAVKAGVTFGDTLSDMKQSLAAVGTQIGAELMPVAQMMMDWVMDHMPQIQEFVRQAVSVITAVIKELIPIIQSLQPIVEVLFNGIVSLWESTLKPMLEGIITFLTGVFTGNWTQAFEGLKSVVSTVFDGIIAIFKGGLNAVIDAFNGFSAGLGSIDIPDWVPLVGGKTLAIPPIPRLAKGGTIVDEGTVMVGERGAELLNLPVGASVVPLGANSNSSLNDKLDAILTVMTTYMPNIGSNIVLNNGALVGSMALEMDRALGKVQTLKARGV